MNRHACPDIDIPSVKSPRQPLLLGMLACAFAAFTCVGAAAQGTKTLKIGVLSDFTGPYAAWGGKGSVVAAELAVEDYKKANPSFPYTVEVLSSDFQLKTDVAVSISKKWVSEGVNAILDVPNSSAALAVNSVVRGTPVVALLTASTSNDLVTKNCSPNMVQWTYDQYSLGTPTFAVMATGGKWFAIMQDSIPGRVYEEIARKAIGASGGTLVDVVKTPIGANDYSSQLVQARASKADAIILGAGGSDLVNLLKQAREFGMTSGSPKLVVPFMLLPDLHAIGLATAQGLTFTSAFYWDLDDNTRAFAKRFAERSGGKPPNSIQAGAYSAVTHYLKGIDAAKTANAAEVVAKMKTLPVSDQAFGSGKLRADGRMVHDMLLVVAKKPAESKSEWDLYKIIKKIPGDQAYRPMSKECPLAG